MYFVLPHPPGVFCPPHPSGVFCLPTSPLMSCKQICCSSYHFWDEGIKRGKHLKILMYVLRASQAVNTCPWTMLVMIGTDCLVDVYITTICSLPWQPPSHFLNKIMINPIFILPKCLLTKSFAIDHLAFVKKVLPCKLCSIIM